MARIDAAILTAHLESALAGDAGHLESFLRAHSNLPGPRGNLELAHQFAALVAGRAGGGRYAEAWPVVPALASFGPEQAPTGDPGEFLAFCGTLAAAAFAGSRGWRSEAWAVIRRAGEDSRWRLREAAAQAIQLAMPRDPRTPAVLRTWAAGGSWLVQRAVVAGVADPPLLADPGFAAKALRLHEMVLARFTAADEPRDPGYRVLRQGLGYTLSLVVAAEPGAGFALLGRLAVRPGRDLAWVLRSNLGKARLSRAFPAEVQSVLCLLDA